MRGKEKTGALRLKKGKLKKKRKLEPPDEAIDAIKKDQKGYVLVINVLQVIQWFIQNININL